MRRGLSESHSRNTRGNRERGAAKGQSRGVGLSSRAERDIDCRCNHSNPKSVVLLRSHWRTVRDDYPPKYDSCPQRLEAEQWRAAVARTYTAPAVIVLVLYFVLWLPGLIANVVYLSSARRPQHLPGRAPEGKGCLSALLWVFFWIPLLLVVVGGAILLKH